MIPPLFPSVLEVVALNHAEKPSMRSYSIRLLDPLFVVFVPCRIDHPPLDHVCPPVSALRFPFASLLETLRAKGR
jgi:hypothetical protein